MSTSLAKVQRDPALHSANTPRTGNVYTYHRYRISIHDQLPSATRFRKFQVRIQHLVCDRAEWREIYANTRDELKRALEPIVEEHTSCLH